MERINPLSVFFYESENGNQPVRDFLLELSKEDRKEVGADIFAVQKGFPLGLPLCRKMKDGIWEIRSNLKDGICRILFSVENEVVILLHGFVKKTQKTPPADLKTAKERLFVYRRLQNER